MGGEGVFGWGLEMVWVGCFEGRSGGFLVARVVLGVMLGKILRSGKKDVFFGVWSALELTGLSLRGLGFG